MLQRSVLVCYVLDLVRVPVSVCLINKAALTYHIIRMA
jgi:hypothetical protein